MRDMLPETHRSRKEEMLGSIGLPEIIVILGVLTLSLVPLSPFVGFLEGSDTLLGGDC